MEKAKKDRLQKKGWKVGSVNEFLDLKPEEAAYIELKYACTKYFKECRQKKRLKPWGQRLQNARKRTSTYRISAVHTCHSTAFLL